MYIKRWTGKQVERENKFFLPAADFHIMGESAICHPCNVGVFGCKLMVKQVLMTQHIKEFHKNIWLFRSVLYVHVALGNDTNGRTKGQLYLFSLLITGWTEVPTVHCYDKPHVIQMKPCVSYRSMVTLWMFVVLVPDLMAVNGPFFREYSRVATGTELLWGLLWDEIGTNVRPNFRSLTLGWLFVVLHSSI